ncbi:MAG: aminopeptidase P family protein [Lachnospiraceae bacterium]|nr:aminopeptidase P family protein [Lachnospiraceae bacterium]
MENKVIMDRIKNLRSAMEEAKVDFYMMPTADFHNSEYVNEYFKVREYFCGFTGSNGTLVVWQDGAGLWTDGRYFIQAEKELEGSGVTLFKMGEEGVPTILELLKDKMQEGQTLGFDGRVVNASAGAQYEKELQQKGITIAYEDDLAEKVWSDRPALPCGKTFVVSDELAGRSVTEKLGDVRTKMAEEKTDALLLTKLDDLMWLFNIRGCDVECNPVALSYGYITADSATLFLQKEALCREVSEHLDKAGVEVRRYGETVGFLEAEMPAGIQVLTDMRHCNYTLYKKVADKCSAVNKKNPTELLKAIKNPVELENMKRVYLQDSVALTKFIYWVKKNVGKMEMTEITAADYLDNLRRQIPGFLDLSFPTISGYKENAAMMHYEATPESHAVLAPEGMLLVDSGGQYMGGTTDVTRTIVLGPISDEIKCHYTAVASGMLQLTHAKWLYGCTGRNLDILARQPLWNMGIDYKCGTGHGIGYILNVHEGPQNIRWKFAEGMTEAVIEAGMDISNEPGVYIEGSHGIRIENIMVAKNDVKNGDGQFMSFDTLTYAPIDLEAIDVKYMTAENRAFLNEYHRQVFEKISPYLNEEEREWLKEATKEV